MSTQHIPVSKYMTPCPHTIGVQQTLAVAAKRMRDFEIRHLPVLDAGHLVGVLSERDILLVEGLQGVDPGKDHVNEAMTQKAYVTGPDAPLGQVAAEMAKHKYGAAVIVDGDRVVGVFTTVDACRALADAHPL